MFEDEIEWGVNKDANKFTFREIIHDYLNKAPWLTLGIDLVLGKRIDVLVNNAGVSLSFPKKNISNYWNKTLAINLTAPYWLSLLCLPFLKKAKESNVVNITSLNGKIAMSNNPAYNASKGGLTALTFSLAMDFAKYKIRANAVSPGYIKTNMTKKSYNNFSQYKKRIDRID